MRVPFDSISLAAVVAELQPLVGGRVQRVMQRGTLEIELSIYAGKERYLYISAEAEYARMHLVTRRSPGPKEPPTFCMTLRKHLMDSRVEYIRQRGLDRVVDIGFKTKEGGFQIVAEMMGKHSNVVLLDADKKILAAIKVVHKSKSKRPILPGKTYEPPPFDPKPSILEAKEGDDLKQFEGASPFVRKLIESGVPIGEVQTAIENSEYTPVYCEGIGAYPLPLTTLDLDCVKRSSISQALEQHFNNIVGDDRLAQRKTSLKSQLKRVLRARQTALKGIAEALQTAATANERQLEAELILAYQHTIKEGDTILETTDYEGNPVTIKLDPKKTPVENANMIFKKAKRAKQSADGVAAQRNRLSRDLEDIEAALDKIDQADDLPEFNKIKEAADKKRWLHRQVVARKKEDRPYEGHRIREQLSPGGWRVLFGSNATSNDYLTTKVARPNDIWFHVRGGASSHVVLLSQNKPEKVQMEDLRFAARLAVSNSDSKHSSYVAVDYVLKKYVRKPRKAGPGLVTYTNEKTLHVET
ncbi:MAG: NFACT family protein [Armatimonadetes bacterium]|nr:NFACT family protein [Armatimonadota bacterium]